MALTALTKTYQIVSSLLLPAQATTELSSKEVYLAIKNQLIGFAQNPWVVSYSCDGVTAGTPGDGIDRWSTVANMVDSSSSSGVRSWMILRNPVTGLELQFDLKVLSTTNIRSITFIVSWAVGFTGGTTTARPTATDNRFILGGQTNHTTGLGGTSNNTNQSYVLHMWHTTDGEVTYFVINRDGNATAFAAFGVPQSPVAGWTNPLIAGWSGDLAATAVTGVDYRQLFDGDLASTSTARFWGNFPTAGDGELLFSSEAVGNGTNDGGDPIGRVPGVGVNQITLEIDSAPVGIHSFAAGDLGSQGVMRDLVWSGNAANIADTHPASGGRTRVVFGALLFPWDGSVPLVS